MSNLDWMAYLQHGNIVIESPTGLLLLFPETDTRYTLSPISLPDVGDGYSLVTQPSSTTYFLPDPDGYLKLPHMRAKLRAALNQYFVDMGTTSKKYMRLPNSGKLVYLVDILSVDRLVHGDHNGTALFIKYPIGETLITCDTIEIATADERVLSEYLLSL